MAHLEKLFGDSPFVGLKEHARKVHECVRLVREVFRAAVEGDPARVRELSERMMALETEADTIQNSIHEQLVSRVLLPVSKADLFNILEQQDCLADRAEDIAATLTYRDLRLPQELMGEIASYLEKILHNCELAESIVSKMDLLVEASFGGRDALTVSKLISELNAREDATKSLQIDVTRKLFAAEGQLPPAELMLWQQLIGLVAELSRYADHTASGIRRVLKVS